MAVIWTELIPFARQQAPLSIKQQPVRPTAGSSKNPKVLFPGFESENPIIDDIGEIQRPADVTGGAFRKGHSRRDGRYRCDSGGKCEDVRH